jgi:multiple sugar transport system permease protein
VNLAKNTLVITLFSMLISLLLSVFAAYSLARYKFAGSGVVYGFLISSAMLPMISTVIPMFQFFKSLKLIDTFPSLILLYSSGFIPFTVLIFVNFIKQTPRSIEEAAEVDGAGTLQKIFLVLLPVLKPAMAIMAIINFISCMNEFMIPLIFATNKVMTLSVGITMIPRVNQYNVPWEKISALGTLMLIPIVLFVVIFEKNIMEGLMTGSVKQ